MGSDDISRGAPIALDRLGRNRRLAVRLEPGPEARAALAGELGILGIRKLRLLGELAPLGATDWRFEGELGATVVQECVVTLDPVTTRLDVPVVRTYLADMPAPAPGAEIEMPEDDSAEPLPEVLNPARIMVEALALALPEYPRADGAEMDPAGRDQAAAEAPDGEGAHPFAGLAALAAKREDDEP